MEQRQGTFHVNASGGRWWPLDPRPEDFDIETIAHHLAMTCRYNGASSVFYSVAEHSFLVSRHVPARLALYGLLHDAAEAVVGDTIQPLKIRDEWRPFRQIEDRIFDAICKRFGLDWTPEIDALVSEIDVRIVTDECTALIPNGAEYLRSKDWRFPPVGADIVGYSPERAKVAFLLRWHELMLEVGS